jgi:hypothetical protein
MKKLIFTLLFAILGCSSAFGASIKAQFDVGFESGFFSEKPTEDSRKKMLPLARTEIWRTFLGRQDSALIDIVEKNKDLINKRLDEIITNLEFVDEQVDKTAKRMKIAVRATVNENILNSIIASASGAAASGQGSSFGFLVIPRIQIEATTFDPTVKKKATATAKIKEEKVSAEELKDTDDGSLERNVDGTKVTTTATAKTSGSTTRKAQQAKWALGDAKDVDASISKYLTEAGFEPSPYANIRGKCKTMKTDEVRTDALKTPDLSDDVREAVLDAGEKCKLSFFAVGSLDVDSIEEDKNSGGIRARASVNIQVADLRDDNRRIVASVGPTFYTEVGAQEDEAKAKALKLAAKEAAMSIVNQLRNKKIK